MPFCSHFLRKNNDLLIVINSQHYFVNGSAIALCEKVLSNFLSLNSTKNITDTCNNFGFQPNL